MESDRLAQPVTAKRTATVAVVALLCTLAAISAFLGITHSLQIWGGRVVLDVVGMQRDEAQAALGESGFPSTVELVAHDGDEGIVLSMSPEAQTRAEEGSNVTLYVSRPRMLPDVVGMSEEDAMASLEEEGLLSVERMEEESDVSAGTVVSMDPAAGERVLADTNITIKVAVAHKVPDVCGMAERSAVRLLQEKGYLTSVKQVVNEDIEAGTVASMDPCAGTEAPLGTTITLYVAVHESDDLIEDTRAYLEGLSDISFDGSSYELMEVKSVSFDGGRSCAFTLKARPFEQQDWLDSGSRRRYGSPCELSGTIEWSDGGDIASTSPALEAL